LVSYHLQLELDDLSGSEFWLAMHGANFWWVTLMTLRKGASPAKKHPYGTLLIFY
jgi:hypothetical protein